jgi:hypothetical protein
MKPPGGTFSPTNSQTGSFMTSLPYSMYEANCL